MTVALWYIRKATIMRTRLTNAILSQLQANRPDTTPTEIVHMIASLPRLITPSEATALLERPTRGRKVHTSSIIGWGKRGHYPLAWCNGWKVERDPFVAWARATSRLRGCGRFAAEYRRAPRANSSYMARSRLQQQASASYLLHSIGVDLGEYA